MYYLFVILQELQGHTPRNKIMYGFIFKQKNSVLRIFFDIILRLIYEIYPHYFIKV